MPQPMSNDRINASVSDDHQKFIEIMTRSRSPVAILHESCGLYTLPKSVVASPDILDQIRKTYYSQNVFAIDEIEPLTLFLENIGDFGANIRELRFQGDPLRYKEVIGILKTASVQPTTIILALPPMECHAEGAAPLNEEWVKEVNSLLRMIPSVQSIMVETALIDERIESDLAKAMEDSEWEVQTSSRSPHEEIEKVMGFLAELHRRGELLGFMNDLSALPRH